jgi:UrcA family protein
MEDSFMNIRNTLVVVAATAGLATSLGAAATNTVDTGTTPPAQTRSVVVRYHASDLNSRAGAEALLSRVSGAATRVCLNEDWMGFEFNSRSYHTCRKNAISRAVAQVDRPQLTAAYDRHFEGSNIRRAALQAPRQGHGTRPVTG